MIMFKWFLDWLRKKGILEWPLETRCHTCMVAAGCPAHDTGVVYPCPYYQGGKIGVNDWLKDNPCWECHCSWWDSDMGCTCPGDELWYQCPLEPEPDWDKIMEEADKGL